MAGELLCNPPASNSNSNSNKPGYGVGAPRRPVVDIGWEPCSGGKVPDHAIAGGYEADGRKLYVARVFHGGGEHPGKAAAHLGGCLIGYGGKEMLFTSYEVLVADEECLEWLPAGKRQHAGAIVGGREAERGRSAQGDRLGGEPLFISRTEYEGSLVLGKSAAHIVNGGISFAYAGVEILRPNHEVLCFRKSW
ncbi:hypothetical protein BC831DRAFT_456197 [Entophlyctis helioformis]|nr:hypothetical protein BC831DRAFT_456197 [Entophlyctis helioformis]